jgi:uncharacterized membrane protein
MTLYELLLFAHVLGAAAWFGAAVLLLLLMQLASRAGDRGVVLRIGEYEDRFANLLFIPSALIVLATGFALVFDGPWSFGDDGWATLGLILFVAIFVLGIAVIVPAGKKLKALASSGAPEAEIDAQIVRLRTLSWIDVALLTVVIFLMTVKPF